jgi:hypothetical protein
MRLPIINTLSSRVEVHTLFLQPTPWCARKCKGCYVKERNAEGEQHLQDLVTPFTEQFAVIKTFCEGELAWANEITIAIDDLPTQRRHRNHMLGLYDKVFNLTKEARVANKMLPKMHMTFHTLNTYLSYVDSAKRNSEWYRESFHMEDTWRSLALPGHLLDMINFSQLTNNSVTRNLLAEIRKETPVNYNYLIPRNVNKNNINKHLQHLLDINDIVDYIYLVIYKDPIGKARTSKEIKTSQRNIASDRFYIQELSKKLPTSIKNKIHIDGCLKDVEKFNATGYGCSSNISRFQIWPNGSVTGCAYGDKSISKRIGLTTGAILQNIRTARKLYDFTDTPCHLVDDYNKSEEDLIQLSTTRVGQITKDMLKDIL